jgi:AraC-like DNA-binding protein
MPGSGTYSFTEPEAFQAGLEKLGMRVFAAARGQFSAQLTRATLFHLHLLRAVEAVPRIAYLSLPADAICISFLTQPDPSYPPPVWSGEELQFGDIMFHGREERLHQWTRGPGRWGLVSLDADFFARYGKVHYSLVLAPSAVGRILRPTAATRQRLLQLHARAGRVVETRPSIIVHPEAARSLENDLIQALVDCLAQGQWLETSPARRRQAQVMERFENELITRLHQNARVAEICATLRVSERTLRRCCRQFLGMGPTQYVGLRRLMLVRSTLLHADRRAVSVADVVRLHGFPPTSRFTAAYRTAFGETPSQTLRVASTRGG